MSRFSGKCDLYDHISGMGGWYDKSGNKVVMGQEGVNAYYSDEIRDFKAFKKATNGVIYQYKKVRVDERNQDLVKQLTSDFSYKEVAGSGKKKSYIYSYFKKEYTQKELNKKGVYVRVPIHFDTIFDLIPYYPYIVASASYYDGKSQVVVSNRSFVDSEADEMLQYGHMSLMADVYKSELQQHYLDLCREYVLKDYDNRVREIPFDLYEPAQSTTIDGTEYGYTMELPEKADLMHKPKFVWADGKLHHYSYWTSPKFDETGEYVRVSTLDVENYLAEALKNGTVKLRYVAALPEDFVHAE